MICDETKNILLEGEFNKQRNRGLWALFLRGFDSKYSMKNLDWGREGRVFQNIIKPHFTSIGIFVHFVSLAENIVWSCRHFRSLHSRALVLEAGSVKYFETFLSILTWIETLLMLKNAWLFMWYNLQLSQLPSSYPTQSPLYSPPGSSHHDPNHLPSPSVLSPRFDC